MKYNICLEEGESNLTEETGEDFMEELPQTLALKERQGFIYSANQCVLNIKNAGIMGRAYRAEIILRAKIRDEIKDSGCLQNVESWRVLNAKKLWEKRVVEDYKL